MKSNKSVINVYKKNSIKSGVVTQLLYGENFKIIQNKRSWIKIKNDSDNYKGYIKTSKFPPSQKNTHKVYNLYAKLYLKPNSKNKIKQKLSFGSKVKVLKKKISFINLIIFGLKKVT